MLASCWGGRHKRRPPRSHSNLSFRDRETGVPVTWNLSSFPVTNLDITSPRQQSVLGGVVDSGHDECYVSSALGTDLVMSLGEVQFSIHGERRRSERSPLGLPLAVRGVSLDTKPFQEDTFTLSVSAHGALVALTTIVTLGQSLYLRNPRTEDEVQVWVTRFGPVRGAWNQVGIEFVQPHPDFWSPERQLGPPSEGNEQQTAQQAEHKAPEQVQAMPDRGENPAPKPTSSNGGKAGPQTEAALLHSGVATEAPLLGILLRSLEQTLHLAAENVVAAATATHLRAAVNQAAETIENLSSGRTRQFEERLAQYQQELVNSAHEEFLSRIKTDVAQAEEHMRSRAAELLEEAERNVHSNFVEKLREEANQALAKFGEEAAGSSAQQLVTFSEQVHGATNEARSQIDRAATALNETQEKVRGEADRAVTETQQKIESLSSQRNEVYAEWESRLQVFREDLADAAELEVGRFRDRLHRGLSSLFSPLG